jgi:hypothetical protein
MFKKWSLLVLVVPVNLNPNIFIVKLNHSRLGTMQLVYSISNAGCITALKICYLTGLLASTAVTGAAVVPPHLGIMLFAMGTPDEDNLGAIANYMPEVKIHCL